eukprot:TRINITY_DN75572_c0_g1_i1.p1 TRINITY_DN75572_c0_g1~~TRINITY_DN75572_c0_g1_i1.p1  ORF type:complete len:742 (-),score=147.97 TRINITY_DN75572_c0_g1_i1:30-2255(-)
MQGIVPWRRRPTMVSLQFFFAVSCGCFASAVQLGDLAASPGAFAAVQQHSKARAKGIATAAKVSRRSGTQKHASHLGHRSAAADEDASTDLSGAGLKQLGKGIQGDALIDWLQLSVVRIHTVADDFDVFHPDLSGDAEEAVGSGFAVKLGQIGSHEDPVFVTNAHVVSNAHTVKVQVPAIGQAVFDAYVPMIYSDMDLALVKLVRPKELTSFLGHSNASLHLLRIRSVPVLLGEDVVAVGFPLGSNTLKLSSGVIAGTEMLESRLVYQSTAPISPGSSGGPLFSIASNVEDAAALMKMGGPEVIGVNFAAAVEDGAQNANYVVPHVHLLQILHAYEASGRGGLLLENHKPSSPTKAEFVEHPTKPETSLAYEQTTDESLLLALQGTKALPHEQLRVAPINAVTLEANAALYKASGGCSKGVYISRIHPPSALLDGGVPQQDAFISAVDGVPIDSFGEGRTKEFLKNPISFASILVSKQRLDSPISLTICQHGRERTHTVNMKWKSSYEDGVKSITEPYFQDHDLRYESFADVTIMQLTQNHVLSLVDTGTVTASRWLLPEAQGKPRLVVADALSGSYASRVLEPGMILESVNGKAVRKLEDLQDPSVFKPSGKFWQLQTDQGITYQVDFREKMREQLAMSEGPYGHDMTPAVQEIAGLLLVDDERAHEKEPVQETPVIAALIASRQKAEQDAQSTNEKKGKTRALASAGGGNAATAHRQPLSGQKARHKFAKALMRLRKLF